MHARIYRLLLAASLLFCAALLIGVGCNGAADCSTDADCFSGEKCLDGQCAVDDSDDAGGQDATEDSQSQDASDDTAEDTTGEDADTDSATDSGGDAGDTQTEVPACVVDKFTASCPDDFGEPNESPTRGFDLNDNSPIGCLNDEFRTLSESHSTWLCANEEMDWYDVVVYPCRESTFRIEATFTPKTECDRALFEARLSNYECSEPNISCAWEGGSYVVSRFIDTNSVGSGVSYYFGIGKITDTLESNEQIQLEYDVTFETRQ
jgi:hypothetical protein